MYLLYESLYGDLLCDCQSTNVVGLYDNKKKAIKKATEIIKEDIETNDYVLDSLYADFEDCDYVRLFWNRQENWSCYYEIFIKKMDLE